MFKAQGIQGCAVSATEDKINLDLTCFGVVFVSNCFGKLILGVAMTQT